MKKEGNERDRSMKRHVKPNAKSSTTCQPLVTRKVFHAHNREASEQISKVNRVRQILLSAFLINRKTFSDLGAKKTSPDEPWKA